MTERCSLWSALSAAACCFYRGSFMQVQVRGGPAPECLCVSVQLQNMCMYMLHGAWEKVWIWITSSLNMPSEVPAWEVEEDACHICSVCGICKHTYWFLWFRPGHLLAGKGASQGSVFGPVQLCNPNNCVIPPASAMISLHRVCVCVCVSLCADWAQLTLAQL